MQIPCHFFRYIFFEGAYQFFRDGLKKIYEEIFFFLFSLKKNNFRGVQNLFLLWVFALSFYGGEGGRTNENLAAGREDH